MFLHPCYRQLRTGITACLTNKCISLPIVCSRGTVQHLLGTPEPTIRSNSTRSSEGGDATDLLQERIVGLELSVSQVRCTLVSQTDDVRHVRSELREILGCLKGLMAEHVQNPAQCNKSKPLESSQNGPPSADATVLVPPLDHAPPTTTASDSSNAQFDVPAVVEGPQTLPEQHAVAPPVPAPVIQHSRTRAMTLASAPARTAPALPMPLSPVHTEVLRSLDPKSNDEDDSGDGDDDEVSGKGRVPTLPAGAFSVSQ